jgi:hypothetical protein
LADKLIEGGCEIRSCIRREAEPALDLRENEPAARGSHEEIVNGMAGLTLEPLKNRGCGEVPRRGCSLFGENVDGYPGCNAVLEIHTAGGGCSSR